MKTNQGLTLSPFFAEVTVAKEQPTAKATFSLYNGSDQALGLNNFLQPLSPLGTAAQRFAPTDDPALVKAIAIDQTTTTIPPQTARTVTVTVSQNPALTEGGHYAAITFSHSANQLNGGNTLGINNNVNALLFITNDLGGLRRELKLTKLALPKISLSLPKTIDLTFADQGNVHLRPFGEILIKDQKQTYGQGIINQEARLLLPNEQSTWSVPITARDKLWRPALYKVTVNYHADSLAPSVSSGQLLIVPPLFTFGLLSLIILVSLIIVRLKRRGSK